MNLKSAAGRLVPLMRLATVVLMAGGCATSIVDQPPAFQNPPTITAIFAVDSAGGFLPDVLVYSSTEAAKVSKAPPSYGSFRVEFDEPMASSVANSNDLTSGAGATTLSYCSVPTGGGKVRLLDGTRVVPTSVCYDPSSPLGSNPHVTVVIGAGATNAAAPSPFTCRFFAAAPVDDTATGVLAASHDYTLDFAAASITGTNGKALTVPTGTGWTGNQFKLSTSGFEVMAVGFQDVNTGFFTWLDKPTPGFIKDLAAVGASSYHQPADDTTFLIVTTMAVDDPTLVTVTRADGTPFDGVGADVPNDARVIEVAPAVFWESDGQYKVTLPVALTGGGGIALPAAQQNKAYTFSSASAALVVKTSTPSAGATAQAITVAPTLNLQAAVDSASATAAGNVTLTGPSGPVAATVTVPSGDNNQQIKITLATGTKLAPATGYTISTQNLKVAATSATLGTVPHAGENFAGFSSQFTTATFRTSGIFNGTSSTANIDRLTGRPVDLPANGNLTVAFTNAPDATTVNATNVTLSELTGTTSTAVPATVTAVGGNPARFTVQITDANYKLKFNQNYVVRAATAIKDSAPPTGSGQNLRAEGCTTGDCSDARSFTTAAFAARTITIVDAAAGKFNVVFSHPATVASINASISTAFQLFKRVGAGQTAVPITCTPLAADATTVNCAANSALDPNTQYTASVVFLSSAPAVVTATISGKPTDQANTGRFFGNIRNTFLSCQ